MEEIWKDIPRYKGYQASNFGRIRTHNKTTYTKRHGERHWKDRILEFKPSNPTKNQNKVLDTELHCGKMENLKIF